MTLAQLRKLSVKKQYLIHFRLRNGMECIVTEHGIAQVPELKAIPDFNLEEELSHAGEFLLEPAPLPASKGSSKTAERPRKIGRAELAAMAEGPSHTAPEHEEE